MKIILFLILIISTTISYAQSQTNSKRLKQAVSAIEKGECVLIFYTEQLASDFEKKQIKELEFVSQLSFKCIDSIFTKNTNTKVRLTLFYVLCKYYRSQITDKHFNPLKESKEDITVCSGKDTQKGPLAQIAEYLYENSVERKEKINSPEALALVKEADELNFKGPVDFEKMIAKLNEANKIEPNNPIILTALGHAKFNSGIDAEGALNDFRTAFKYSLDQKFLEMRHYNLGLNLMGMGDIQSACKEWQEAGKSGISNIEQYCQSFDTIIYQNTDDALILKLSLNQDTAFITSSHNPPSMSDCYAKLSIENNTLPKITIKESNIRLYLENTESELYLEAISENGKKFQFFTEAETFFYGNGKDLIIAPKEIHIQEINLTANHQFPITGTYKVRIAMRPSKNILGLTKTYYSNWVPLIIAKKYQKDSGY